MSARPKARDVRRRSNFRSRHAHRPMALPHPPTADLLPVGLLGHLAALLKPVNPFGWMA